MTISSFRNLTTELRRQLQEAKVDHHAFDTPLKPCDLAKCRATCCHDGVVLENEEVDVIGTIAEHLSAYGLNASVPWLTSSENRRKTATRSAQNHELANDFPSHFTKTRCVFLDENHHCMLQRYSAESGSHPWFYKPIGCWMHPVALLPSDAARGRPLLTLRTPENSSGAMTAFAACTHCGRAEAGGSPASEVLREELSALSEIAGRDFLAELNAPPINDYRS